MLLGKSFLTFASAIAVAGCVTPVATPLSQLRGSEWVIEDIGGRGVIDNTRASLLFGEGGHLSGSATCNRLMATYRVEESRINIDRTALTRKACPPALMEQEARLVDMLENVASFEIDATGALLLRTASGSKILARR